MPLGSIPGAVGKVAAGIVARRAITLATRAAQEIVSGGPSRPPIRIKVGYDLARALKANKEVQERAILWASVVAQNATAFRLRGTRGRDGELVRQWRRNMAVKNQRYPGSLLRVKKATIRNPVARVYSNDANRPADTIIGQQIRGSIRRKRNSKFPQFAGYNFVPKAGTPLTATGQKPARLARGSVQIPNKRGGKIVLNRRYNKADPYVGVLKRTVRIPRRYGVGRVYREAGRFYLRRLREEHRKELRKVARRYPRLR